MGKTESVAKKGVETPAVRQAVMEKPTAFFKGEEISLRGAVAKEASAYVSSLFERVEKGHKIKLIFDVDGVLLEMGVGTTKPKTLDKWAEENKESLAPFEHRINSLKHLCEPTIIICTGRSLESTEKVINLLFPKGSVDHIIAEGGAIIDSGRARSVDHESLTVLKRYKEPIINEARKEGVDQEKAHHGQKSIILTLNSPRVDHTAPMTGEEIKAIAKKIMLGLAESNPQDREMLERLSDNVIHTPDTAEIAPLGVSKLSAIEEITDKEDIIIYAGDSGSDLPPMMRRSNINLAPANATPDVQRFIRDGKGSPADFIGISAPYDELKGTTAGLRTIEYYYRILRRPSRENVYA
jgi:hydroxymethylpyrimidine pyrophosphatase-like HAD family hydrolase